MYVCNWRQVCKALYMHLHVRKCTTFMPYSNHLYTSVTLPRMEGVAHYFLRRYTKIGSAMKTLTDTAVEMIKARQQESGNTVVCSHYVLQLYVAYNMIVQ